MPSRDGGSRVVNNIIETIIVIHIIHICINNVRTLFLSFFFFLNANSKNEPATIGTSIKKYGRRRIDVLT